MKLRQSAVLAVVAAATSAAAFVIPRPTKTMRPITSRFAIEDLEAKLLGTPSPKPAPVSSTPPQSPRASQRILPPTVAMGPSSPPPPSPPPPTPKPHSPRPRQPAPPAVKPEPKPAPVKPPPEPKPEATKKEVKPKAPKIVPVPVPKPPPKTATTPAANDGDISTIAAGVALGGAPLALAGLGALAAARGALAATAERREKIQAEIAAREAQKKAYSASADAGGLTKAAGFLGAALVSLGLIVANPIGQGSSDFQLPSLSLPSIGQAVPTAKVEPKPPSPADLAAAKIRAAQAARLEEKRLANEAKLKAAAAAKAPARAQGGKTATTTPTVDTYESLFSRATLAGPQTVAPVKEKAAKVTKTAADVQAVLPEDALEEAKSLQADAKAAAKVIAVEEKKVEKDLAAVEKAEKAAAEKAAKLAEDAKAAQASALAQEKASSDQAVSQKAAEEAFKAKEAAAQAAMEAKELAKKEAMLAEESVRLENEKKAAEQVAAAAKAAAEKLAAEEKAAAKAAAEKPAPAPPATPAPKSAALPSDMQVSDETLMLLRSLNKK